jgi:formyltetrahydrofolate deformylase
VTGSPPADTIGRLLIRCADRQGIVATVASFLSASGANILSLDQHATAPSGGTYFQRTEFALPSGNLENLRAAFASDVARPFGMEFTLTDSAVPKRLGILVSRIDHCLLDLLWRTQRGELDVAIDVVVSNHDDLRSAVEPFGVPFVHVPVTEETKPEAEARQAELLRGVDVVVLARYMQVISRSMLDAVGVPMINIHHSFLPAFVGASPYRQAKERGVKVVGATAHYVTEVLDDGPIIEQDVVRVNHRHTTADLTRLGADVERSVLARAVLWHCEDRVVRDGDTTIVF